ncbi:MAG: sulfite exporter TauE/SafE family protein [Chloroflexi bacterium]|nr:sulfite exporter TauE/SafE family protein [Chloroflexota bacterium]
MTVALGISVGLVTGVLAGMLGVGGAVIMIPAMVWLLGVDQHTAQGVSLAVISATALVGSFAHYRQKTTRLDVALWIAPTAVVFGVAAASVAGKLDAGLLRRLFALLMMYLGARMFLQR